MALTGAAASSCAGTAVVRLDTRRITDWHTYAAMVECPAFVNRRRIERGMPAVLALSFFS